ncbi:MAG TPA: hypothetical protein VGE46_08620 [Bdellovibrio sp.]
MVFLRRSKYFWVAASLCLHVVLAAIFFFYTPAKNPPVEVTEIELQQSEKPMSGPSQIAKSGGPQVGRRTGTKVKVSTSESAEIGKKIFAEGSKISFEKAGSHPIYGDTVVGEGAAPQYGNGQWVEQVGFDQAVELTAFFAQILKKLNRTLDYPNDMAVERIVGDVRLDFYVNKKGQMIGDFQTVKGSQDLLNLYVMSATMVVLREALPENLWAKSEEKIAISLHVHFENYQFSEMAVRDSAFFNANELNIVRARYVVPLAVDKTMKVFTHYVPPIIPIPGGFYVDLVLLAEYIDNIGKPDPDDKRKERLKVTREQLESAIKKKASPGT